MASGPNPAWCLFLYSQRTENGFYIFKWWKKKTQEENILWHVKISWRSNFSIQEQCQFGMECHPTIDMFSVAAFELQRQSWSFPQRPSGLQSQKSVRFGFLQEMFIDPLSNTQTPAYPKSIGTKKKKNTMKKKEENTNPRVDFHKLHLKLSRISVPLSWQAGHLSLKRDSLPTKILSFFLLHDLCKAQVWLEVQ